MNTSSTYGIQDRHISFRHERVYDSPVNVRHRTCLHVGRAFDEHPSGDPDLRASTEDFRVFGQKITKSAVEL